MKKRIGRPVFFVLAVLIIAFALLSTLGISTQYGDTKTTVIAGLGDVRWGIDIRGGVNVTFGAPDDYTDPITSDDLDAAKVIIETRLVNQNINDYEVFVDLGANNIIVRFPWQADDNSFDPEQAVKEIGATAMLSFRMGYSGDLEDGQTYEDLELVLQGKDVANSFVTMDNSNTSTTTSYAVSLQLNDSGKEAFKEATKRAMDEDKRISIWMDDEEISAPTVNAVISDGSASISGGFNGDDGYTEAKKLSDLINGGSLPFKLEIKNLSTISPILGTGARDAMGIAGVIAFIIIAIFMIAYYRLPGFVAVIALAGQIAGMFAACTGFFGFNASSTLTIPGIAGIILSVGMGVDGNVLSAERIREELKAGRTIDGAIKNGFQRGFTAILDSNLTVIIVAVILMLVFGTWFGASTDGTIYSFGFTLLVGVIMNFIMACWATRLMVTSLSRFKVFRKPWLYGGAKSSTAEKVVDTGKAPALPEKTGIDFVSRTKVFAIISAAVIALTVIFTFVLGVKVDIRFKGGSMLTYSYTGVITEEDTAKVAAEVKSLDNVPEATVTTGTSFTGGLNTMVVSFASDEKMDDDTLNAINAKVMATLPDNNIENVDTTNVSASSGSSFMISCVIAVAVAFVLLAVYIAFRFKKIGGLSAGIIAIICLLHDVAITYAVYVFGGMSLDSNFMAVILTLLGYSINNTIIIYDRLRENRAKYGTKFTDSELVNLSINQTIPRSIITTATTVCAMISVSIVCALMGTTSILTFSIPLAIGMLVGFYSSVCLAGPIWIWVQNHRSKKAKA
ncbi:MAG: protein translocase subunit SecF [Oscillospiraceae bacterium]|nr:protein translocase subunit SecF [Oscillospiraceae bacterium]